MQGHGRATGSYKMMPFLGSGSKHASKTHTQKKIEVKRPGEIYLPTRCGGAAKSWLMHKGLPYCMEFFLLAPIHSVAFLQDPVGL